MAYVLLKTLGQRSFGIFAKGLLSRSLSVPIYLFRGGFRSKETKVIIFFAA